MIMKSDEIGELAKALSAAQSTLEGAIKDAANPFFKSRYATLESVWEAARGPLTKNGLAVSQTTDVDSEGPVVITWLLHQSGQWLCGQTPIVSSKPDAQSMGAAITYARRFALAAIIGIVQSDDDGHHATGRAPIDPPKAEINQPKSELKPPAPQPNLFQSKPIVLDSPPPMWEGMEEVLAPQEEDPSRKVAGDYKCRFGKHLGKMIREIPMEYLNWLENEPEKSGKAHGGLAKELLAYAHAFYK